MLWYRVLLSIFPSFVPFPSQVSLLITLNWVVTTTTNTRKRTLPTIPTLAQLHTDIISSQDSSASKNYLILNNNISPFTSYYCSTINDIPSYVAIKQWFTVPGILLLLLLCNNRPQDTRMWQSTSSIEPEWHGLNELPSYRWFTLSLALWTAEEPPLTTNWHDLLLAVAILTHAMKDDCMLVCGIDNGEWLLLTHSRRRSGSQQLCKYKESYIK